VREDRRAVDAGGGRAGGAGRGRLGRVGAEPTNYVAPLQAHVDAELHGAARVELAAEHVLHEPALVARARHELAPARERPRDDVQLLGSEVPHGPPEAAQVLGRRAQQRDVEDARGARAARRRRRAEVQAALVVMRRDRRGGHGRAKMGRNRKSIRVRARENRRLPAMARRRQMLT
jgi:hypothetical protein